MKLTPEETQQVAEALTIGESGRSSGCASVNGSVAGVIFAVSNDGGKTGVAWREDVHEAFAYLDLQNVNGGNYAVVAVRKPLNVDLSEQPPSETPGGTEKL